MSTTITRTTAIKQEVIKISRNLNQANEAKIFILKPVPFGDIQVKRQKYPVVLSIFTQTNILIILPLFDNNENFFL